MSRCHGDPEPRVGLDFRDGTIPDDGSGMNKPKPKPNTHVALLRGINVGGKNKLPMKELVGLFAAAGAEDVRSYIQSGNVVLVAKAPLAKRLPRLVSESIHESFGYDVPVVMRSASEIADVVASNPYLRRGADESKLHVALLMDKPSKAKIASLDPKRSPADEYIVSGREIYLHLPNGVGKSKLTNAYFDAKLDTVSTIRNWRTMLKLVELSSL
jgi:uncharacterized protein (DUF1697 family)